MRPQGFRQFDQLRGGLGLRDDAQVILHREELFQSKPEDAFTVGYENPNLFLPVVAETHPESRPNATCSRGQSASTTRAALGALDWSLGRHYHHAVHDG